MSQTDTALPPVRVGLISLGCAKNLVDAEIMLGSLMQSGMHITSDAAAADVVIVNSCSFIDAAQEESVDTILESAALREAHHRGQALVVSGCLPQRFRAELPKLLPEVDAFMGIDQVAQVDAIVRQALANRRQRIQADPPTAGKGGPAGLAGRTKGGRPKTELLTAFAELDQAPDSPADAGSLRLRGTETFGRTRTVVGPPAPSAAAPSPLVTVTARPTFIPDYATPRFRLTPRHFAYVKIAEGCNHPCSFCIIPRMRGTHRSRPQADLLEETRRLIADGVRELNLISQDTTFYGLDLRPRRAGSIAAPGRFAAAARELPANGPTLVTLLRELNALPGDFWLRLLYTHPAHWTDEVIDAIAGCGKVARYVDMPLQHIHDNMLQRMRRETSRDHIVALIARLRERLPGIALRTTFIVGFPGETEACFEALLEFIRETRFERLGVFTYSCEEGTVAGRMADQVSDRVKQHRRNRAMAAQLAVARQVSAAFVGRTLRVLVEKEATARELMTAKVSSWEHGLVRGRDRHTDALHGRYLVARGEADAPDIDGRVYVRGRLPLGEFAQVRVVGHTDYDLIAEPA